MDEEAKSNTGDGVAAEELALLQRAQGGDYRAFEELVARYQSRIFRMAVRMVGQTQDAEDVVQQTFLSLIEHIESFRGESSFSTWLLRIATNHALKILRKRRGLSTVPLESFRSDDESYVQLPHPDFIADWRENPADLVQRQEVKQVLNSALAELDDSYRFVFVLRDIEGLSVRETAEILGISEANVKVRLLRARLQMRERLTRVFGDETTRVAAKHSD